MIAQQDDIIIELSSFDNPTKEERARILETLKNGTWPHVILTGGYSYTSAKIVACSPGYESIGPCIVCFNTYGPEGGPTVISLM